MRCIRIFTLAVLIAVYGGVTLLGSAIHLVQTDGHLAEKDAPNGTPGGHTPADDKSSDDCPICKYLAQGQLPFQHQSASIADICVAVADCDIAPVHQSLEYSAANPRAPPV